jgi:sugar lactone lactonase YvrE
VENLFKLEYDVDLLLDLGSELLEGPTFDFSNGFLYFVSIFEYKVYRYDVNNGELLFILLETPTSCVFLCRDHGVVVSCSNGFFAVSFDTFSYERIFEIPIADDLRFNDGILDPNGRFLIGTMGFPNIKKYAGSLWSYDKGNVKEIIKNVTISIDTPTRKICKYNYDKDTGNCAFDRDLCFFKGEGVPDGMDIDDDDNLWVAEWGGYCVSIWNSRTGNYIGKIEMPSQNVTSVCFDHHKNLYVTTAKSNVNGEDKGGAVFYVKIRKDV